MRIGMVLDNEFINDKRVENEIIALQSSGFNVFLLCVDHGQQPHIQDFHGAQIIRIPWNRKRMRKLRALTNTFLNFYPALWAKHITRFVKKYQIDILHMHDLYMFGAGFLANKQLNNQLKIVGDLHENYADGLKAYKFSTTFPGNILISIKKWKQTEEKWIKQLDYAITVIDEMKQRITPYIDSEKIFIYQNVVKMDEFLNYDVNNSVLDKYRDYFTISYIGGIDYHRGIKTVIDALPLLIDRIPYLHLCIVGNGKILPELKQYAQSINVEKIISFEGWQTPRQLPNFFQISDIGLIPHLKSVQTDNSSPNKLYQYMLLEKPIISTNCVSLQRIIEETSTGLVYESGNPKDLAEKILHLYSHPELREKMGANGKKAVLEKYNWEKMSQNLVKMYRKIEQELSQ